MKQYYETSKFPSGHEAHCPAPQRRPVATHTTPGQSTVDRILALHLLAEKHMDFRKPVYAAFTELKDMAPAK